MQVTLSTECNSPYLFDLQVCEGSFSTFRELMWELIYSKKIEDDVRARLVLNKSISFYRSIQNPGNDSRISINNKSGLTRVIYVNTKFVQ